MHRYLVILMAALAGCSGSDKDTDADNTGAGDDDDDTKQCTNSILTSFPEQGETDVYYKTDVRFSLVEADPAASIKVTDGNGAEVTGQTTVSDKVVTWSGDDLQPSTQYTATLSYTCGEAPVTWTTSNVGGPVAGDLTNRTYALDVATGEWVQPAGVGDLLASQLGDTQIFLGVTEVAGTSITMQGAIGSAGTQDLCSPTIPFPAASWENPYFSLQADQLPLDVSGIVINIDDLDLSGAFAPDGTRIQGGSLKGAVDTRPLGEAFDLGTAPEAVCDLVATFGVACAECSDGTGPYCLEVWVDNINAAELPGTTITPREAADIEADPNCQ